MRRSLELKLVKYSRPYITAKEYVARFLKPTEVKSLDVWTREFFISRVDILSKYLDK